MEHAKFKVGDIIEKYGTIIKIETILPYMFTDIPRAEYFGKTLTKKLVPYKNGSKQWLFEEDRDNISRIG